MTTPHTGRNSPKKILTPEIIFSLSFLFSGASLLVALYLQTSLAIALMLLGIAALSAMALVWLKADMKKRSFLKRKIIIGLIAGIASTLTYDAVRLILVKAGQLPINPFETFRMFGLLIGGTDLPTETARTIGTAYHFLNGISFAIAYTIFLGERGWKYGIAWALILEALMLTVYPGWLDLEAVMKEFVTVSVTGHIAYGAVLGSVSARLLKSRLLTETKNSSKLNI